MFLKIHSDISQQDETEWVCVLFFWHVRGRKTKTRRKIEFKRPFNHTYQSYTPPHTHNIHKQNIYYQKAPVFCAKQENENNNNNVDDNENDNNKNCCSVVHTNTHKRCWKLECFLFRWSTNCEIGSYKQRISAKQQQQQPSTGSNSTETKRIEIK